MHFAVLVIGTDVEQRLAPFQENNMGDCPKEYLRFYDLEEEHREDFENGTLEMVVLPSGEVVPSGQQVNEDGTPFIGHGWCSTQTASHFAEKHGWERREALKKEVYADFETYLHEYHGVEKRDPETGRYGYWENPNRKWDWWCEGGRWSGYFRARDGQMVNSLRKGDWDMEATMNLVESEFRTSLREYLAVVGDDPTFKTPNQLHAEGVENRFPVFWEQPGAQKLREAGLLGWGGKLDLFNLPPTNISEQEIEEWIALLRKSALVPFAMLAKVGQADQWLEPEQRWSHLDERGQSRAQFVQDAYKLLMEADDDALLTIVDCHI